MARGYTNVEPTAAELAKRPASSPLRASCDTCGKRIWISGLGIGSHEKSKAHKAADVVKPQPQRQVCCVCLASVEPHTTVDKGDGRRFHFCAKPECLSKAAEYAPATPSKNDHVVIADGTNTGNLGTLYCLTDTLNGQVKVAPIGGGKAWWVKADRLRVIAPEVVAVTPIDATPAEALALLHDAAAAYDAAEAATPPARRFEVMTWVHENGAWNAVSCVPLPADGFADAKAKLPALVAWLEPGTKWRMRLVELGIGGREYTVVGTTPARVEEVVSYTDSGSDAYRVLHDADGNPVVFGRVYAHPEEGDAFMIDHHVMDHAELDRVEHPRVWVLWQDATPESNLSNGYHRADRLGTGWHWVDEDEKPAAEVEQSAAVAAAPDAVVIDMTDSDGTYLVLMDIEGKAIEYGKKYVDTDADVFVIERGDRDDAELDADHPRVFVRWTEPDLIPGYVRADRLGAGWEWIAQDV